jgi:hypothetical protein
MFKMHLLHVAIVVALGTALVLELHVLLDPIVQALSIR